MVDYNPVDIPQINPEYQQQTQQMQDYATRPSSSFQADINQNLDKSNLMGPSENESPESQALNARARQNYNSQMTQLTRNSVAPAMQRKVGWEANQIDNNAALFSNMQSRMAMQYQQAQFQRQSAIVQAGMQYQMYNSIFKGVGFAGGWAAKGLFHASNPAPTETNINNADTSGMADFNGEGWAGNTA